MTTPKRSAEAVASQLMNECGTGFLGTVSVRSDWPTTSEESPAKDPSRATASLDDAVPYVSLVSVARVGAASVAMLLSRLAVHTQNLTRTSAVSLLLCESTSSGIDPMSSGRATLIGELQRLSRDEEMNVREVFLQRHPNSRMVADFSDFAFYVLRVNVCHVIAGLGRIETVPASRLHG